MKKTFLLLTALGVGLAYGGAGVAFLKIPVDARYCGIGEAAAAYADNGAALYYNPAGLAGIESFDAVVMHNEWLLGMNHEYAAVGYGDTEMGSFGLSFNYWGSGEMPGLNWRGETIPGYTFSVTDWCANLGYGRDLDRFSVGLGVKYVSEQNESLATSAWAADAGVIYRIPVPGLKAGLSVCNLGTKLKLDQEAYTLPYSGRLGWRYDWRMLGVTQDFILSSTEKPGVAVGAECRIAEILSLRVGYRTGSNTGGLSYLRAGLGVFFRGIGVDYAFAPYGQLGMTHRLSVSFRSRYLMPEE